MGRVAACLAVQCCAPFLPAVQCTVLLRTPQQPAQRVESADISALKVNMTSCDSHCDNVGVDRQDHAIALFSLAPYQFICPMSYNNYTTLLLCTGITS